MRQSALTYRNIIRKKRSQALLSLTQLAESHSTLLLVLFTALGILIAIRSFYSAHSMLTEIRSDEAWTIATHVYQGQGYTACSTSYFPFCHTASQVTAEREPVPVFMFLSAMAIYPQPLAGFILEVILYLAIFYILYFSLRNNGRLLALSAGLLWLISIPVIKEIGNGSGDLEAAFWVALAILFFQKARSTHRYLHWALAGLFLGLAALSRTVIFGVALVLIVGLLFEGALGGFKKRLQQISVLLLVFALVLSPWVIRNQVVFGSPIFSSTLTGYNVYRQNFILEEQNYYPHYVGAQEARDAIHALVQTAGLRGNENEFQMENFYLHEGLKIILSHPTAYAGLVAFRFFSLWFDATVKAGYGQPLDHLDMLQIFEQIVILALAIIGAIRFPKKLWPLILAVCATTAAYMLVDAQVRYLVEVMPLIVTLAVWGLFKQKKQASTSV